MSNSLRIKNTPENFLEDVYDLIIFPVGYEERGTYIARRLGAKFQQSAAYVFPEGQVLSFAKNLTFATEIGATLFGATGAASLEEAAKSIQEASGVAYKKVLIDISSFNRRQLAAATQTLLQSPMFGSSEIVFAYSLAEFREAPSQPARFVDFGPITGYEGWTAHPERPTVLVIGLGYDEDHALGAIEFLDPTATFCFVPIGADPRFGTAVLQNNKNVLELLKQRHVSEYRVLQPFHTIWELLTLVQDLLVDSRVVLVPMGPKIFCSICMLAKHHLGDEISVWRASGHDLSALRDVPAAGQVCAYTVARGIN